MKTVEIVMPMRKPVSEVTDEDRRNFHTWIETKQVPETVKEFARLLVEREEPGFLRDLEYAKAVTRGKAKRG